MTFRPRVILLCLPFMIVMEGAAQLKHLDDFRGVIDVGVSRLRSGSNEAYEAGFQYTNDGNVGVGISYLNIQSYPRRQGFGAGVEKALYRPVDRTGLGLTLFGSVATAWGKTSVYSPSSTGMGQVYYIGRTITVQQTSFGGGAELYLHTPRWPIDVEPFLRAGYSSVRTTADGSVQSVNAFSAACGAELLLSFTAADRIIITQGALFSEHAAPTIIGQVIFSHAYH